MRRATRIMWLSCILASAVLTACAGQKGPSTKATIEMSDEELFNLGMGKMEKGKYLDARALFRQLELRNPRGALAPLVKLAIADSYYKEGSPSSRAEGVAAYRSFLSFYPKHARACYAQMQIARYHLRQLESPQRDQTETENAIAELQKLLVNYPDCEFTGEARAALDQCFNRLAEHELKVAEFYFKLHKNTAALSRYLYIINNYYKFPMRDKVLYRLSQVYRRLGDRQKADEALDQLANEFPQSPYIKGNGKSRKAPKVGER